MMNHADCSHQVFDCNFYKKLDPSTAVLFGLISHLIKVNHAAYANTSR